MNRAATGLLMLALLVWAPCSWAADETAADAIHEYRLDNGMKVLVRPDRRAHVVVSQVWYRVGSVDEHRGLTGVSHVLEHMMFKGTDDHGPGEMSEIVARLGGSENAFTSQDYTTYFQQISSDHLERMLELEADRMTDLTLDPTQFKRELRVVREERRRRVEDKPRSLTWERLTAAAFPSSPRRTPIIGWQSDLQSLKVAQVRDWYAHWYAPNNAALVVVGDVDPERVLELARRHFGDKRSVALPRRPSKSEVEPRGETRLQVHATAKLPYLAMAWRVPSLVTAEREQDVYALDVLTSVLDGGRSARLARRIVRGRQIASGASAGYSPLARTGTLLSLSGTPAQDHDMDELEQALRGEIEQLKNGTIDPAELERVKTNVRADDVFQRDSMFYQALRMGLLENIGAGQDAYAAYQAGVQRVTAADVQRVARKYLTDQRLTVARLVPEGVAGDAQRRSPNGANGGSHVLQ